MLSAILPDVDPADVVDAVGAASYARGVQYSRQRAVVRMQWDRAEGALRGSVHGRGGDFYATTAYFSSIDGLSLKFEQGECSCPVGFNCKHVAALVLTAMGTEHPQAASRRNARPLTWEQSLGSLLQFRPAGPANRPSGTPLAVELTLSAGARPTPARGSAATGAPPRLLARVVAPGKNGWVGGGLSWTKLSSLPYYGDYLASHVRLLQEMYAVYRSRSSRSGYNPYGEEKSIDLSAFESRQLWTMLDEADTIGLRLVHGKKRLVSGRPWRVARSGLKIGVVAR